MCVWYMLILDGVAIVRNVLFECVLLSCAVIDKETTIMLVVGGS